MKSAILSLTFVSTLLSVTMFGHGQSLPMQSAYNSAANIVMTKAPKSAPSEPTGSTSEPFENDFISMEATRWEGWVPLGRNIDGNFGLVAKKDVLLNADYLNFSTQRDDFKNTVSDNCEGKEVGRNRFLLKAGQRCDIGINVRPSRQAAVVSASTFAILDPNDSNARYESVYTTIDWRSTVLSYDAKDTELGEVVMGMENFESVRLTNISTVKVTVSVLDLDWGYSLADFPRNGFVLEPGEFRDLTVRFSPLWEGRSGSFYRGNAIYEGNGSYIDASTFNPTVNYPSAPGTDGTGIRRVIEATGEDIEFGQVKASTSSYRSSWVTNSSNVPLDFQFEGTENLNSSFGFENESHVRFRLEPGEKQELVTKWTPEQATDSLDGEMLFSWAAETFNSDDFPSETGEIRIGVTGTVTPNPTDPSAPVLPTVDPTLPTVDPTDPSAPVLPTVDPTLPTVDPTDPSAPVLPTVDPTLPTVDPTDPSAPVLPTVDPTLPTVDPTDPSAPVLPTVDPTLPTVNPTDPSAPALPTVDPTLPTVNPTDPSAPALPTVDPTLPTVNPTDPSAPALPTVDPTLPTVNPTDPSAPALPTVDPTLPTVNPTDPSAPALPTVDPTDPESSHPALPKTGSIAGGVALVGALLTALGIILRIRNRKRAH